MTRPAVLLTRDESASFSTLCVFVGFDGTDAVVVGDMAVHLAGVDLPRTLSASWCAKQGLSRDVGSSTVLRTLGATNVALVSLGENASDTILLSPNQWRLVASACVRAAWPGSVAIPVPLARIDHPADVAASLVEGALLTSYRYKETDASTTPIGVVALGDDAHVAQMADELSKGVQRGVIIGESANWAKKLIDTPPGELTPSTFATVAQRYLGELPGTKVSVWDERRIEKEKLGGLLGVSQGSHQPPRLVRASHGPRGTKVPHVVLVGKGVTFDSGGLSLKSGDGMMTMKTDMSGAAIVLAALSAVARLDLPLRVSAWAPMTENLPSGTAIKPGDVLTIRNGRTIEVLNTDAEGRLILADALSLAVEQAPDVIVDVATLTGAQRVALGDEIGAMFCNDDDLAAAFVSASERAGEPFWRLPLFDPYESHIVSEVADMKNTGKAGSAGALSAALILRKFVGDVPWVHLDIAGPGRSDTVRGYYNKGATAYGARTIIEFLETLSREGLAGRRP